MVACGAGIGWGASGAGIGWRTFGAKSIRGEGGDDLVEIDIFKGAYLKNRRSNQKTDRVGKGVKGAPDGFFRKTLKARQSAKFF